MPAPFNQTPEVRHRTSLPPRYDFSEATFIMRIISIGNGKMIEAPYPGTLVRVAAVRYGDLVPYAGRPTP